MISFDEWKKPDLRVGKILEAREHANADKLFVLKVDIGKEIQLVAGLRNYYDAKELIGKKIIVVANLEPVVLRGEKSEGMLLAAVDKDKIVLITPEKDVSLGVRVT